MMRPWALCALMAWTALPAWAGPSVIANESISFVSGPTSPSAEADTLTGSVPVSAFWNPRLRAGVSAQVWVPLGDKWQFAASYGVFRDQRLCDTCADGAGPGYLGDELLGSTDLNLSLTRIVSIGKGQLTLTGIAVLPASKDALRCNPMFGVPGVAVGFAQPIRKSVLSASARATRPLYRYSSAPVGRCAPELQGESAVSTLTGMAEPTPWDGTRFTGANPTLTGGLSVVWRNPHAAVWEGAPKVLTSGLSVGIDAQRSADEGATTVPTTTGRVDLNRAFRPLVASVPWSVAVGIRPSPLLELQLQLANRVPTLLADPGGTFLALPSRTTVAILARQRLGKPSSLPPSQR